MTPKTDTKADRILSEIGPSNNQRFAAMSDFAREMERENERLLSGMAEIGKMKECTAEVWQAICNLTNRR